MSTARHLCTADIVETVGSHVDLGELEELEVLFLSVSELGGLESTPRLRKLTLIDNGLTRISNLTPVALTLTSLCLCDQDITTIDGLSACANLRELFLHRNFIASMDGLRGCSRLRKLWLFQNKISKIEGLHSLPELTECWLQANYIRHLRGLEHCASLQYLALAGNPIEDYLELRRLMPLQQLQSLSLSDIHFGRCPLADDEGYKHFVVKTLPQVKALDDVAVTKERQAAAHDAFKAHDAAFEAALDAIEDDYRRELAAIDGAHKGKEQHSHALDRELTAALQELQALVQEGRLTIRSQAERQRAVMDSNLTSLHADLASIAASAKDRLAKDSDAALLALDATAALCLTLERALEAEEEVGRGKG